jgi:uncharacterized tellurite resistance protein B-like protein
MLQSLRELITRQLGPTGTSTPADRDHALRLATAALLVEMSRADASESAAEQQHIVDLVVGHFDLPRAEAEQVLADASARADAAVSLHEFTRLLNDALAPADKQRVIELLWRVAFADGTLDRYEDHLVRKVADLLYVPHAEFIRAKLTVQAGFQK